MQNGRKTGPTAPCSSGVRFAPAREGGELQLFRVAVPLVLVSRGTGRFVLELVSCTRNLSPECPSKCVSSHVLVCGVETVMSVNRRFVQSFVVLRSATYVAFPRADIPTRGTGLLNRGASRLPHTNCSCLRRHMGGQLLPALRRSRSPNVSRQGSARRCEELAGT